MIGKKKQAVTELTVGIYQVRVTHKKMKNAYLRVKSSAPQVDVSAPMRMSDKEIIRFVTEKTDWIEMARGRQREKELTQEAEPVLAPFQERELRVQLNRQLRDLIAKWEPIMGVKSSGFTIRKMKTRWGSCNVKTHHLNFNFSLCQLPEKYVEYVVVHELTHLLEASHSERFWRLMEQYLPGSKTLRKELNQYHV